MSQKRSSKPNRGSNHSERTVTPDFQEELERYQASIKGLEEIQGKLERRLEAFKKLLEQFNKAEDFQRQVSQSFSKYIEEVEESKLDPFTQNLVKSRLDVIHHDIVHLIARLNRCINEQAKEPIPWYEEEYKRYKDKIENHKEQAKGYIENKNAAGLRDLTRNQEEFRKSKDRTHPSYKYL
ncbi:uncharacterized protein FOMMEDRAFT_28297 [Fomitiporia mediterranea MF3/22]|uniref:uncharacterized protein n=1 Tax=Fomitiporia mediterranea (strain MF3/22) TaxID=694068 RepID=UPI0004407623|nr:uncharacterized protein FOMMEDRAFT_28297 [Fomitiporia mediterranea MF3/22]EJD04656.1 hypothetical protein FOMMEDRAFT_28297 [Fomitiporia mediterranea MF3/22]